MKRVRNIEEGLALHPLGVIVATPPETHWQVGFQVSKSGLPCLIEKPLASDLSGAEGLCHAFEKQGVPLAVGYQLRFDPVLQALHDHVETGKLGEVYAARAEFAYDLAKWRKLPATYEADIVAEASHDLDLCAWIIGEPATICATVQRQGRIAAGVMDFKTGVKAATFHLDSLAPKYRRSFLVYGTVNTCGWYWDADRRDEMYVDELKAFLGLCHGGNPGTLCTEQEGMRAVRMMEAIYKSVRSGRWETC